MNYNALYVKFIAIKAEVAIMSQSKLEIYVQTGKNQHGDYMSRSLVQAYDQDSRVRESMIDSGARAAAMMAHGHANALAQEHDTVQRIEQQDRRLLGQ